MSENTFINVKNQSFSVTAEVVVPKGGAEGVLIAQGGRFGGWALHVLGGKPVFSYNCLNVAHCDVASTTPLPVGKVTVRFDFAYDGKIGEAAKSGTGTISVKGVPVGKGRIDKTECCADPGPAFPGLGEMKPEQLEIERLRREVAKLKAERDILKKAAAYFAREAI